MSPNSLLGESKEELERSQTMRHELTYKEMTLSST